MATTTTPTKTVTNPAATSVVQYPPGVVTSSTDTTSNDHPNWSGTATTGNQKICRHCKKVGHVIAECRSLIAAGLAKMPDKDRDRLVRRYASVTTSRGGKFNFPRNRRQWSTGRDGSSSTTSGTSSSSTSGANGTATAGTTVV